MNINIFFILVLFVLTMILFLFKPLNIKQKEFKNIPLFNISSFTIYELDTKGLTSFISGSKATRYEDRYTIQDMDYTDNSKDYLANMKANSGIYKDEIINLIGDVVYFREDGLTFETQAASYNQSSSVAKAKGKYVLYRDKNRVVGTNLRYNNLKNIVNSDNITAVYQIKKRNK